MNTPDGRAGPVGAGTGRPRALARTISSRLAPPGKRRAREHRPPIDRAASSSMAGPRSRKRSRTFAPIRQSLSRIARSITDPSPTLRFGATSSITVETNSSDPSASRRFASRTYSATSSSNFGKLASLEMGVADSSRSRARMDSFREDMRNLPIFFDRLILKVVATSFPSPISNGRFFRDAG